MSEPERLFDFLASQLADPEAAWSVGSFGAIAEFMRDADEAVDSKQADDVIAIVTARGGLRIAAHAEMRPVASESLTTQSWSHRVALCLPEGIGAMDKRTVLTEIGPDADALRTQDRAAVLFDLGLATMQVNACIRVGDPEVIAALTNWTGRSLFEHGNGAMGVILSANPHRVFVSRLGRVEVYQPIPAADGRSPEGPHTHVLPRLLRHRRTHAATEFVPAGWVPCAHLYPPHPARDTMGVRRPFRQDRRASFQKLLVRFGDAKLLDVKRRVFESVVAGQDPRTLSLPDDRFGRAAVRIALRQFKMSGEPAPAIDAWLATHDRVEAAEAEEEHPCTA
jgi:hypothetical protein